MESPCSEMKSFLTRVLLFSSPLKEFKHIILNSGGYCALYPMQKNSTHKRRDRKRNRTQVKTPTTAFCHMALACVHGHSDLTPLTKSPARLGKVQTEGNKDGSRQSQMNIPYVDRF